MALTGRVRHRTDWRRRMILQVEDEYMQTTCEGGWIDSHPVLQWRDAKIEDIHGGEIVWGGKQ